MINKEVVPSPPNGRILLVDDELHVRSALARSLMLLGYQTNKASSGREALAMLKRAIYDVMILDLRMPDMDGVEVMNKALQMYPDLLVIILTGHATLESAIAAVKAGAVDYLLKPASVYNIAAVVAKALKELAERKDHSESFTESPSAPAARNILCCGPVVLELETLSVTVGRAEGIYPINAKLTLSEAKLLTYLMQHHGAALSCHELVQNALCYNVSVQEAQRIVRPHMCRLRNKIEPNTTDPQLIRTIVGKGYIFVAGIPESSPGHSGGRN